MCNQFSLENRALLHKILPYPSMANFTTQTLLRSQNFQNMTFPISAQCVIGSNTNSNTVNWQHNGMVGWLLLVVRLWFTHNYLEAIFIIFGFSVSVSQEQQCSKFFCWYCMLRKEEKQKKIIMMQLAKSFQSLLHSYSAYNTHTLLIIANLIIGWKSKVVTCSYVEHSY